MAADSIDNLAKYPRELEFIRAVPADWAESHLIAGSIGEYAIFARKDRASQDWYVGGVNDATARTLTLDFGFLPAGKAYTATIYKDADGITYADESRHRIAYDTRTIRKVTRCRSGSRPEAAPRSDSFHRANDCLLDPGAEPPPAISQYPRPRAVAGRCPASTDCAS
jgi:hypothetical protein